MEEGYVKFQCQWEHDSPLDISLLTGLMHWRNYLFDQGFIGAYPDGIGFGNISSRLGDDHFIISGTQTGHIPRLNQEHFTVVEYFDLEKNELHCRGPIMASSESMTHGTIYRQDKRIGAVIHIHHLDFWQKTRDIVPTTSAEINYGTPEMAHEVYRLFRETAVRSKKIIVMAGHREGMIFFGKDLAEAANVLHGYARKYGILPHQEDGYVL